MVFCVLYSNDKKYKNNNSLYFVTFILSYEIFVFGKAVEFDEIIQDLLTVWMKSPFPNRKSVKATQF